MRHFLHNRLAVIRKIIRRNANNYTHYKAHRRSAPDPPFKTIQKPGRSRCQNNENRRSRVSRRIQRPCRIAVLSHTRAGYSDNGSQKTDSRIAENHSAIDSRASIQSLRHNKRRGHSRYIGIKQIRSHTGHVSHVVSYIICDNRRIPGIILRYSKLYLTCQVSGHIGRLRKDTAAGLRKKSQ